MLGVKRENCKFSRAGKPAPKYYRVFSHMPPESNDDLEALIRSMDAPPMLSESGLPRKKTTRPFVRPRRWFEKPVKKIRSGRDAFHQLAHLIKTWSAHEPLEDGSQSRAAREFFDRDKTLADFARENPGQLEDALMNDSAIRRLACTQTSEQGGTLSVLNQFMAGASPMKGELLWRTMSEIDPMRLTEFLVRAASRYAKVLIDGIETPLLRELTKALDEKQFKQILKRLKGGASRERLDVLELMFRGEGDYRLPEILPEDAKIASMKPERILKSLADYMGLSPRAFQERLEKTGLAQPGENPGESIRDNIASLVKMKITRQELAAALAVVIRAAREHHETRETELREFEKAARERGQRLPPELYDELYGEDTRDAGIWWTSAGGLTAKAIPRRSHLRDPFHMADVFSLSSETGGGMDILLIHPDGTSLQTNDILPYLIRRAGMFTQDVTPDLLHKILQSA